MKLNQINILHDLVGELRHQPPPEVLNFQVNDVCNARCVMCNIWKNKKGPEMSPTQLAALLDQPFFKKVAHVGITGGEPTLRGDLAQFYESLLEVLPNLVGASFITNGFRSQQAVTCYSGVHKAYTKAGKSFGGMVSLDGIDDIHDQIRGRPGSFLKATQTLFGLQKAGVPVHTACTIVKGNVWGLHDLLDWAQQRGIYVRFRVGEFIRRLYNQDNTDEIRAFDPAETKHLISFFHKLLLEYEEEEQVKNTYQSILSILSGGKRLVGCPYHTSQALNLDCQGRFAICAPQGTPTLLGEHPERSTRRFWERLQTRLRSCEDCIHDYHAPLTKQESKRRDDATKIASKIDSVLPHNTHPSTIRGRTKNWLILGWYGTETAGDIAILGGLLLRYRAQGMRKFTVLSFNPTYSRCTLLPLAEELNVSLQVSSYDEPEVFDRLNQFDGVSMGGGPLMDIEPTETIRNIFRLARAAGLACHVDGCGIGPLHQDRFIAAVTEIISLASVVRLRDQASADAAAKMVPHCRAEVISDPSHHYLQLTPIRWKPHHPPVIRAWLRMLTHEYPQPTGLEESTRLVADFLRRIREWHPESHIELCAMHWFPIGWDDREFARDLQKEIGSERLKVDLKPRSPREILELMSNAELNICMRFHSVVFAHSIGAPFVAIDYTSGGKIDHFLNGLGLEKHAIRYPDLPSIDQQSLASLIFQPTPATTLR